MTDNRRKEVSGSLLGVAPFLLALALLLLAPRIQTPPTALAAVPSRSHLSQPGENTYSIALRTGAALEALARSNRVIHPLLPFPVAGTPLRLAPPVRPSIPSGHWLSRAPGEPLIAAAARTGLSPWVIAWGNGIENPYWQLGAHFFVPGVGPSPSRFPNPLKGVRIKPLPAVAGQAVQVRVWAADDAPVTGDFEGHTLRFSRDGESVVALLGLGGFVEPADYHLNLVVGDQAWSGRVRTVEPGYGVEEIWLSEETKQYLDAEAIRVEQARLNAIFVLYSPEKQWAGPWRLPILGEYTVNSAYGTRRSYNGGPARSYHEGVDFNGLTGRTVVAPAAGTVALAEALYVRGNAVILYHGMGVYTGYYHLSQIEVSAGQKVLPGDKVGEVGSSGLSTGSHLHWDVVVAGINVDGLAWRELTASW